MALFLRPEQMLVDLALRLGPYATPEETERVFDALVPPLPGKMTPLRPDQFIHQGA
jgi:hypothetical protein